MGCDIHLYIEKRVDNAWVSADEWKTEREVYTWLSDEYWATYPNEAERKARVPKYTSRDYELFGILAGVRYETDTQLAPERGVPDDVSPEVAGELEDWKYDAHSHSYITLAELLAYDWATNYSWNDKSEFTQELIPHLETLGAPDDVRIVFFFDN